MKIPSILIVDDEKNAREGLARALQRTYDVQLADHGAKALELVGSQHFDVVLSDVRMPGMDGLTLLQRILARTPQPVVIMLTAFGSIELAVEAMKRGAYDFMTKPINLDRLEMLLQRALRSREVETENRELHEQLNKKFGLESFVGTSLAMQEVYDTIKQVAPSRATVLITGETGTGKELVAHAIHRLSPRAKSPFVAVHCAALSETLLESELFGHEKGSFTGAAERRRGRFELADGGTLFLDEIGEINPATQVKILRVLGERNFERVGGNETIDTDVRLIAATNRDLEQMVAQGKFRQDLFFRLDVVAIRLPPLRERAGDIPLLIQHYLAEFAAENAKKIESISPDAMDLLTAYSWPGNVRELVTAVERMVVLARGDKLTVRDLPVNIRENTANTARVSLSAVKGGALSINDAERQLIVRALELHKGNVTKAAIELGISRRTLHRKLNEYGLREGHKN